MCVVPFQAPGRFAKLNALLELPAKGHTFNTMPVNQHRRGVCAQAGAEGRGYPCPQWLVVIAEDTRLTPVKCRGYHQTQNSDMVPIKVQHLL